MLVLTRKVEEIVRISGGIELKICRIKGGEVRLGFTAPPSIEILRGELDLENPRPTSLNPNP